MWQKKIFRRLYYIYFSITASALILVLWYSIHSFNTLYHEGKHQEMRNEGPLLVALFNDRVGAVHAGEAASFCTSIAQTTDKRITVILPDGTVIADSREPPERMDNHSDRPEVRTALAGKPGTSIRYSSTVKTNTMYAAFPVFRGDSLVAVLRISGTLDDIDKPLFAFSAGIMLVGAGVLLITTVLLVLFYRWLKKILTRIQENAVQLSSGKSYDPIPLSGYIEIDRLSLALNTMAQELDTRVKTITQQRNQQEAILSGMVEGVIAADDNERIMSINNTAVDMLRTDTREQCKGKMLQEVIRNSDIHRLFFDTLQGMLPQERDIHLPDPDNRGERCLEGHAAPLKNETGAIAGVVIVLHDVTRLKQLETMRRDFVANVSHELRTPLTSIKGFVETLQDGALSSPQDAKRFLGIIGSQVDRLNAIVEDLLSLSRLERENGQQELSVKPEDIAKIMTNAVKTCENKARQKNIALNTSCPDACFVSVNAFLLEQALINLIDNAIKYSPADKNVSITAQRTASELLIEVKDQGIGIAPEHHGRLFERFYRVDKARSRKDGGTGLGLSIVKHIMVAHRGTVDLESVPGKGSSFFLHIPL